jgi:hypothetical protein
LNFDEFEMTRMIAVPEIIDSLRSEAKEILDPLKAYAPYRITDQTIIQRPEPIITLHGETISTPGNITTISGPPKSGKTAFLSVIEAGAISITGIVDGIQGIYVKPNPERRAVIHLDSELTAFHQQQNQFTILKRVGMQHCPDYYFSYNLRPLSLIELTTATAAIIQGAAETCNGIHLIVVDGIADYICDVNDADAANAIIKWTEQLAIDNHCPVLIVVHTNPNGDKERGHLGSQAQRKSESVLQIKTDGGDVSFVEPKYLRSAGKGNIPPIQFAYDREKGYHTGAILTVAPTSFKDAARLSQLKEFCTGAIGQSALNYRSAVEALMRISNKGERTAKELFKEAKAHNFIIEDGKLWRLNY